MCCFSNVFFSEMPVRSASQSVGGGDGAVEPPRVSGMQGESFDHGGH